MKAFLQGFGKECRDNVVWILIAAFLDGFIGVLFGVLFGFDLDE